jgi:ubiquinone/menaquinone biosynthesis C-methylase UbiE
MAREFPKSQFTGLDFSADALALGRDEGAEWGLRNVQLQQLDVSQLDVDSTFDGITAFDAIHDQAWPRKVLRRVHRALKQGGVFLMSDVAGSSRLEENLDHPFAVAGYSMSYLHCMTVSLSQGGEGLGTMWGEQQALELLDEAGFSTVEVKHMEGDWFNNYFVCRK